MDEPSETVEHLRRATGLALWAQIGLGIAALLVLIGLSGPVPWIVMVTVGIVAAASFFFLWNAPADVHGPDRRAFVTSAGLAALAASVLVVQVVSTTTTVPTTMDTTDLLGPVYLVPLFLVPEATASALAFWNIVRRWDRVLLGVHVALAVVASVVLVARGVELVADIGLWLGPTVSTHETGEVAVRAFLENGLPWWSAYLLFSRVLVAWPLFVALGRMPEPPRRGRRGV